MVEAIRLVKLGKEDLEVQIIDETQGLNHQG